MVGNPSPRPPARSSCIASRAHHQATSCSGAPDRGHLPVEHGGDRAVVGEDHVAEPDVAPEHPGRRLGGGPVLSAPRQGSGQDGDRPVAVGRPGEVVTPPRQFVGDRAARELGLAGGSWPWRATRASTTPSYSVVRRSHGERSDPGIEGGHLSGHVTVDEGHDEEGVVQDALDHLGGEGRRHPPVMGEVVSASLEAEVVGGEDAVAGGPETNGEALRAAVDPGPDQHGLARPTVRRALDPVDGDLGRTSSGQPSHEPGDHRVEVPLHRERHSLMVARCPLRAGRRPADGRGPGPS